MKYTMAEKTPHYKKQRHSQTESILGLPDELQEFRHLFKEYELADMLPEHQPWDYIIEIMEGKIIKPQKMQQYNQEELMEIKKFINKLLVKQYIRKLKSSYKCFSFFALKKDRTK
jgi:hypothetical protein